MYLLVLLTQDEYVCHCVCVVLYYFQSGAMTSKLYSIVLYMSFPFSKSYKPNSCCPLAGEYVESCVTQVKRHRFT